MEYPITVVTALFNKAFAAGYYFAALDKQDIDKKFEVILVDDGSMDGSVERFSQHVTSKYDIRIIHGLGQRGQCAVRNEGIRQASSKIVFIADADIVLSTNCLRYHINAHDVFRSPVVVMGPTNFEWASRHAIDTPLRLTNELLALDDETRTAKAELQSRKLHSYLNCVTRNVSMSPKDALELFDESYGYIASDPSSGFGWEDIELGCRLAKKGFEFFFDPGTVTVHVSHPPSIPHQAKGVRCLRNFLRLLQSHPEVIEEDKTWFCRTATAIKNWVSPILSIDNKDLVLLERFMYENSCSNIEIEE